jgi:superfamily II RNA helicase
VNELVLTELILENTLAAYEPEEVVALLSAFVFQEKTEVEPMFPPRLEEGRLELIAILERVTQVQNRHQVAADEHRWTLNFGLMEAVYEWAKGMVGVYYYIKLAMIHESFSALRPTDGSHRCSGGDDCTCDHPP